MISKEELFETAKKEKLKPYQEEKKYIQTTVLQSIYSEIGRELVFKGGTALFFFNGLNRFSEDLDFTQVSEINLDKLMDSVKNGFEIRDMEADINDKKSKFGKTFLISAKGPLYSSPVSECHVTIEISERNDLVLEPVIKNYVPLYADIMPFSAPVMDLMEMACEKVRAIMKRDYARDVYDLWFLIKKGHVPDKKIINKKMNYYKENFDFEVFKNKIMEKKSIWNSELESLIIGSLPEFEECSKTILEVPIK